MTAEVDNLVLEHLIALRNEVATLRTEMRSEFADVKLRLHTVEGHVAALHTDSVRQIAKTEDFDRRLSRIETRLELREH